MSAPGRPKRESFERQREGSSVDAARRSAGGSAYAPRRRGPPYHHTAMAANPALRTKVIQ
jgi:hypothetical protein